MKSPIFLPIPDFRSPMPRPVQIFVFVSVSVKSDRSPSLKNPDDKTPKISNLYFFYWLSTRLDLPHVGYAAVSNDQ